MPAFAAGFQCHCTTGGNNPPVDYDRITPVSEKTVLILASNSPRRQQLLALGGWMFHVQPAEVDESLKPGEAAGDYVLRLAKAKARACAQSAHSDQVIVAADTTVVLGDEVLGKPADLAEAARMLARLRGRTHQVYTGLAVLRMADKRLRTDLCITDVPMRDYSDEEINAYVATGDPLDKAGAYAIQHPKFQPVAEMKGCFASVMGLPLCHLVRTMRRFDLAPGQDAAVRCQAFLDYTCPVNRRILRGEKIG